MSCHVHLVLLILLEVEMVVKLPVDDESRSAVQSGRKSDNLSCYVEKRLNHHQSLHSLSVDVTTRMTDCKMNITCRQMVTRAFSKMELFSRRQRCL